MSVLGITTRYGTAPIQRGGWLDALRFIVACMIILTHYQASAPIALETFHPVFQRAYLLTDFFLIDSGYVLARVYSERVLAGRMSRRDFFAKRFLRVVPGHLVMVAILVGLVLAAGFAGVLPRHPEWFDWSQLPAQVLLVQSYGVPGGLGWNAPSWSISALLGCYACFPLLLRVTNRLPAWAGLAIAAAVLLVGNAIAWRLIDAPIYQMAMRYGFLRALPLFFIGMALARFSQVVYVPPRLGAAIGVAAALGLALVQGLGAYSLVSLFLISVIILAAATIPVSRRHPLVETAALASFSMFITNEVVRIAWFGLSNALQSRLHLGQAAMWGLWALGLAAALVFAFGFYFLFDKPTQRWAKAWLSRGKSSAKRRDEDLTAPGAIGSAVF
jgi:peptidoglycan/LPS O-acetylase OafA/YrhL